MFGEKVKMLRLNSGKTQAEIADDMKEKYPSMRVSQTTVSAWESSEDLPRGKVLKVIAEYWSVPVTYFMEINS